MPDDTPQHLALPIRVQQGYAVTTPQDTQGEIATNVLCAVSYQRGYLHHDPTFGAKPSPFAQGGTDLAELGQRIVQVEERADNATITAVLHGLTDSITIDPVPAS